MVSRGYRPARGPNRLGRHPAPDAGLRLPPRGAMPANAKMEGLGLPSARNQTVLALHNATYGGYKTSTPRGCPFDGAPYPSIAFLAQGDASVWRKVRRVLIFTRRCGHSPHGRSERLDCRFLQVQHPTKAVVSDTQLTQSTVRGHSLGPNCPLLTQKEASRRHQIESAP